MFSWLLREHSEKHKVTWMFHCLRVCIGLSGTGRHLVPQAPWTLTWKICNTCLSRQEVQASPMVPCTHLYCNCIHIKNRVCHLSISMMKIALKRFLEELSMLYTFRQRISFLTIDHSLQGQFLLHPCWNTLDIITSLQLTFLLLCPLQSGTSHVTAGFFTCGRHWFPSPICSL